MTKALTKESNLLGEIEHCGTESSKRGSKISLSPKFATQKYTYDSGIKHWVASLMIEPAKTNLEKAKFKL